MISASWIFFDTSAFVDIAAVGRGASGEKDMKRAGSGHKLGEGEGLRLASVEPIKGGSNRASCRGVVPLLSAAEPMGSPKWKATACQPTMHFGLQEATCQQTPACYTRTRLLAIQGEKADQLRRGTRQASGRGTARKAAHA